MIYVCSGNIVWGLIELSAGWQNIQERAGYGLTNAAMAMQITGHDISSFHRFVKKN
jgi:hypothetical protein